MRFPVHRSEESTPGERGEAFGRAQAGPVAHTLAVYRRMFAETHGIDAREAGAEVRLPEAARAEIAGIATGAEQDELELRAVNARTEILAGAGPTECSVVGAGGLLAQNWDWHPDSAASTVIWIVQHQRGWFATLTEAGLLAKIGLNDAGLGVCLNLLATTADGGLDGTPIHVLLRQTLETCRTVDEAIALLTAAKTSASSAVTVATPGDVATSRALTRRRERHPRQRRRAHEPLPRAAARGPRHHARGVAEHDPAPGGRPRPAAARRAALPRRPPEGRLPAHRSRRRLGRADRHGRVGGHEPRRAAVPRRRRAALHARARAGRAARRGATLRRASSPSAPRAGRRTR